MILGNLVLVSLNLSATQGASITLPNGETVSKAFRGIATKSQERLALAIRSGVCFWRDYTTNRKTNL